MNSAAFLSAVKQEVARLQQIQSLLENEFTDAPPGSARKPISEKRGGMSEAGKARVAEAQRKRWAAKKAAVEAESAAAKKQAAAPVKKSAKTVAASKTAKKQRVSASNSAAGKTATTAKKVPVKKPVRKQPSSNARVEAPEANPPLPDAVPSATEGNSSNE